MARILPQQENRENQKYLQSSELQLKRNFIQLLKKISQIKIITILTRLISLNP